MTVTENAAGEAVIAATNRLYDATRTGDAATLADLLCDDLGYFHSNGGSDEKDTILEKVGSGLYGTVEKIDFQPQKVWVVGDVAVVVATVETTGMVGEYSVTGRIVSSLDVWRYLDDRWQLLAHHLTLKEDHPA
jgi:ketosteroid isomerase-like protein